MKAILSIKVSKVERKSMLYFLLPYQRICKLKYSLDTKRGNLAILLLPQWVSGANQGKNLLGGKRGEEEMTVTIRKPRKKTRIGWSSTIVSVNVSQIQIVYYCKSSLETWKWPLAFCTVFENHYKKVSFWIFILAKIMGVFICDKLGQLEPKNKNGLWYKSSGNEQA